MADPLFILAPPRSFTSVICGMIGQHPEMYGLPEVNLFAADSYAGLGRIYQRRPGFRHGLLRAVAELGLGGQTPDNVSAARAWLEEFRNASTATVYHDLAEWAAPRSLVDKSPLYVYSADNLVRMEQAFPGARYLHLVRHPRSTCESIYRLREQVREGLGKMQVGEDARRTISGRYEKIANITDADSLWLEPHIRIMEFLEAIPAERQQVVRGEDFMTNIDEYLGRVAGWLGVDTGAEAVAAMKHPERSPFAGYGPPAAKFGNDPSYLEDPALREYKPKSYSLDGPLEGGSGAVLSDSVKDLARYFGYA